MLGGRIFLFSQCKNYTPIGVTLYELLSAISGLLDNYIYHLVSHPERVAFLLDLFQPDESEPMSIGRTRSDVKFLRDELAIVYAGLSVDLGPSAATADRDRQRRLKTVAFDCLGWVDTLINCNEGSLEGAIDRCSKKMATCEGGKGKPVGERDCLPCAQPLTCAKVSLLLLRTCSGSSTQV